MFHFLVGNYTQPDAEKTKSKLSPMEFENYAVNSKIKRLKTEFSTKADKIFLAFTPDRGLEFALLTEFEKNDGTKVYFAHPYSSYERGINERYNRILRRFVKKEA